MSRSCSFIIFNAVLSCKTAYYDIIVDYGLVLTEICIDANESVAMKQLAAVLLRQYVDIHWCEDAEKFSLPETPAHVCIFSYLVLLLPGLSREGVFDLMLFCS